MSDQVPVVDRDGASRHLDVDALFAAHRVALAGYCYRMLGSGVEAEDAVQETLLRAWRASDRFDERRSAWRTWLFAIATNVCLDMLRGRQRRARAMDLGPAADGGPDFSAVVSPDRWIYPVPDRRIVDERGDPADVALQRETIRLAFVAALQYLPARQRAVLILRDVLRWRASEVAAILDSSDAAVNSALQRARAALAERALDDADPFQPLDPAHQQLLQRYCDAFERHDMSTLVSLLHEDATMSMPPIAWWIRGRRAIRRLLEALAPTLAYDNAVMGDGAVPRQLAAKVGVPTLVLDGGDSPADMRSAARQLAGALPDGRHRTLADQNHDVAPDVLAPALQDFFAP